MLTIHFVMKYGSHLHHHINNAILFINLLFHSFIHPFIHCHIKHDIRMQGMKVCVSFST